MTKNIIKFFDRLEKNKTFWFLFGISLLFFFFRLPSLMEPNWYGDEGVYQVIGMALNNEQQLYSEIWDNKPPLLYIIYGLFQGNQFGVRVFSLFIGLLSLWAFFSLNQQLFKQKRARIIATVSFALLFSLPLLEGNIANAENFILLPIIAGACLIYQFSTLKKSQKRYHFIFNPQHIMLGGAGFLLGVAFLIKSVAIFDFFAFFLFLFLIAFPQSLRPNLAGIKTIVKYLFVHFILYFGGFVVPLIITTFYFILQGTAATFFQAAFMGNIAYVNTYNTLLSHNLLFLKTLILLVTISLFFWKRATMTNQTLFILIWIVFSLFSVFFSQRSYPHYVLMILPSLCLLLGLLFDKQTRKKMLFLGSIFIAISVSLTFMFHLYNLKKTFLYYQNAFLFILGKKDVISYQSFFDQRVPRDYELASFLKLHTKPNEKIFIWGDTPQLYTLSNTLPVGKYTVAYQITEQKLRITQTQNELDLKKPHYIVILDETPSFPFQIADYTSAFVLDGAVIYERTF